MKRVANERPRVRNQRVSNTKQRRQQHLLDVKVRSHKATQHRNHRLLVLASKALLVIALCASLYYGIQYGSKQLFFENLDYRLTNISVQTDGTLHRDTVLKAADLREGVNIFSVSLGKMQEQLQALPQVDEVQIIRTMPSSIEVRIVERKPVAWITSGKELGSPFGGDGAFLVDARGVLMREKKLLPEYLGLPVIVGCSSESLESGKVVETFEAKAALELLRLSTGSFMQTRFQVREIDVSKGYCLVVTDKNHTRVTFGFDDLEQQLRRLEQFLVYTDDSNRELETVNLLVQRNVPVTFAKTAAEIINETVDTEGVEQRILKALPATAAPKAEALETGRPRVDRREGAAAPTATKLKATAATSQVRKATPVQKGKKSKRDGE